MKNGNRNNGRRHSPSVVVLAGPNGSGKSTVAPELLKGTLAVTEFVNADIIAQGLSGFAPQKAVLAAGIVMVRRLKELALRGSDFAFETTLAGRSFAPWLEQLRQEGWGVHLMFLWLPSAEFAVRRVAGRVRFGGHDVPKRTIRGRYRAGLKNLLELYLPICTDWNVLDNSAFADPRLIARGNSTGMLDIRDSDTWRRVLRGAGHAAT